MYPNNNFRRMNNNPNSQNNFNHKQNTTQQPTTQPQNPNSTVRKVIADMSSKGEIDPRLKKFLDNNAGTGVLKVQAYLGNGALPLPNVQIEVTKTFDNYTHTFFKGLTDENGIVDNILLPAPPKKNSLTFGEQNPFASYELNAIINENRQKIKDVAIFDGIKSIQPIKLFQ